MGEHMCYINQCISAVLFTVQLVHVLYYIKTDIFGGTGNIDNGEVFELGTIIYDMITRIC